MPTSEQSRSAPDHVMREVVQQLADGAPLAPDWDALTMTSAAGEHRAGRARRNLLLVAAVTLLVVAGLWWIASPEPDVPADVPIMTIPSMPTGAPTEVLLSDLAPVEAQLCLTRKNVRLLIDNEAELVESDDGLAGYTPLRARLGLFAPPVNAFASMLDHPELDNESALRLGDVVEHFRRADRLAFGGEGASEAPEFAAALDELVAALVADIEQAPGPALCSPVDDAAPDYATGRTYGRCVATVRLDLALERVGETAGEADVNLAVGAAVALREWYNRPPAEIVELVAAAGELVDVPSDRRSEAAAATRARLESLWPIPAPPCVREFVEP